MDPERPDAPGEPAARPEDSLAFIRRTIRPHLIVYASFAVVVLGLKYAFPGLWNPFWDLWHQESIALRP